MSLFLKVRKVPTQDQALKDCVWVNPKYSNLGYASINGTSYEVEFDKSIDEDEIALNSPTRLDRNVQLGELLEIPYPVHVLHTSVAALDQEVGQLGVTVRNGSKWMQYNSDFMDLCECVIHSSETVHLITGRGKIINKGMCPFREIPARIVELEHCADARTYSGLLIAMKRAYPNFTDQNIVTWIEYIRVV